MFIKSNKNSFFISLKTKTFKINKKSIIFLIVGTLLVILAINMINSVSASDNANKTPINDVNDNSDNLVNQNTEIKFTNNNIKSSVNGNTNTKAKPKIIEDGCSSIILQINKNSYVYGYRRNATYAANLYLKKVKLYGIEALKEYKTTNTYFFHSIIFKNGWYLGAGGTDNPRVNKYLENLGAKMVSKKSIKIGDMKKAMKQVKSLGLGHFVIKSPDGKVGVAIYNRGSSKLQIFKMKSGECLCIPNSPRLCKKNKYTVKKSNPVNAAIYIGGTDRFGVNRRNIMIYNVTNTQFIDESTKKTITKTKIKIWVTNDNGKYIGRNTGKSDNVIFKGKKTSFKSIPKIPNKKYIGKIVLK